MNVSPFELVERAGQRRLLVIGAPLDGSGTGRGEMRAPAALRAAGLVDRVGAVDFGDLDVRVDDAVRDPATGTIGVRDVANASGTIRDAVASALAAGWRPLVLGGCCSILPGALAGVRRQLGPAALAFVDGHLDLFDGDSSGTGEVAGMALAIAIGHGADVLTGLAGDPPLVHPRDVIALGDGDHPRRVTLRAPGPAQIAPEVRVIDCTEIVRTGVERVGKDAAEQVGDGTAPFWLHLDADVVDADAMGAVSFPVATGLGWSDVGALVAPLLRSPRLIGLSVTDYNADLDETGEYAGAIAELLQRGLAEDHDAAVGRRSNP
jgi:arginase